MYDPTKVFWVIEMLKGYVAITYAAITYVALTKVAILQTKLSAGNDHVIDIFTSEDMENISLCIFSILLSTIYNKYFYLSNMSENDFI